MVTLEKDRPAAAAGAARLLWRAVVQVGGPHKTGRAAHNIAWHLATCASPSSLAAHCAAGQQRLAADVDPDGHCLLAGGCPRCLPPAAAASAGGAVTRPLSAR